MNLCGHSTRGSGSSWRCTRTPSGTEEGDPQKEPPGGIRVEPDDHALGRLTTKLYLAVERGQKPMSVVITAKVYASRHTRAHLRRRGIRCTLPDKADQAVRYEATALAAAINEWL
ncbi:hypothetical protein ABZ621_17285 [Streptomyces sp. NPDC007863]|uniref:hypothetical protein n=1 Tax=Streptomyces sp. NPDC007863 TaxID=3154894 RepID=UPI003404C919